MASRTGADGFLAPLVKAASTRHVLVLAAAAALLAGGCGGSDEENTAAPTQTAGQAPAKQEDKPTSAGQGGKANAAADSTPGGGKQGAPVTLPKGPREKAPSAKQRSEATLASIHLTSPSLPTNPEGVFTLPPTYTCDGENEWPALKWSGVPADTVELALTVVGIEPVGGELFFDWAVAGLDPSLEGIEAGSLPAGAVLGKNSFGKVGYSICPPPGRPETFIFTLYALPSPLGAARGFDPAALREEILERSGNAGILAATYGRG